jgi:uncharacterized membrane protein (DUF4010 family)
MPSTPPPADIALLLGLSFFLGFAFEDFLAQSDPNRPGGVRTFPLLALAGGMLYLFDPAHFVPFTAGLVVLGAWLIIYYQKRIGEPDEQGETKAAIVIPLLNIHAYLLGAVTLALPHWVAVATTVAAVMLLTGRQQLHDLARRIEVKEVSIAAQFLILTGIVLPLLPNTPVTTMTSITPRQVWLALVVVCTFSYVSYLTQRYWAAAASGLWMAALGGLYSSTATTVVLARQAKAIPAMSWQARAGITLATAIMYLRILAIVGIFNMELARRLALPMCGLAVAAAVISAVQYWYRKPRQETPADFATPKASRNPLELGAAAVFAGLFVAVSLISTWATKEFGAAGIYTLAGIVGISDVDPFVLNLAQGGLKDVAHTTIAAAILIATSSNNILKAIYAASFGGGRATATSAIVLVALALAGFAIAAAIALYG